MTDPITPERVTPHRPVMADPLLVAGHVCQECGRAGDDPEVHPPERVTLTEAVAQVLGEHETFLRPRGAIEWICTCGDSLVNAAGGITLAHRRHAAKHVERILSDRLRAAQADAWDEGYRTCESDFGESGDEGDVHTANPYRETP